MLEEIRTFVAVVKAGSFTGAADSLDISRSVISKKLSDLENTLGVRLINRTTRRLSLTEGGERFYERCRESLFHLEEAVEEVRSLSSEPKGRLFVNLPMSFGILHVAPLIAEFLQRYPGIKVELNFDDRKVEMIDPGYDLSIRIADLEDSTLAARRLAPCHHQVVATPAYLEKFGEPKLPQDLARDHVIASFRLQDSALEWEFRHHINETVTVKLTAAIVANNSLALKEIVLGGAAIARIPTFLIGPEVAEGKLINLLPDFANPTKSIYAVFPNRLYMPSKTRVFIDFLAEKISDPPRWNREMI